MKKIVVFIIPVIFLLTFLSLPTKVSAETELDCTAGVTGSVLDDSGKSIGKVGLGLTSNLGGNAKSGVSDTAGSFSIGGLKGILTLSYNPYNDTDYERGNVILNQCTGILIKVKKKEPSDSGDKNRCNKSCGEGSKECDNAKDGCTYCGYRYDAYLTYNQSWHCTTPPAEDLEETAGGGTFKLCTTITDDEERKSCFKCFTDGGSWTALGCLPTNKPADFVNWILKFAIGIGGGIAFLLILFGAFQIILSAGNPERVKAGKEMITSAIAGLLLIIFAVFILRLIGYDILGIPGFGK